MRSERRNISKKQRISLYSSHDSRRCFNHNIEFGSKLSANKSQCSAVAFGNSVILHSVTKNVIAYTYKMHCCVCNFRQFGRNTFPGCKINGKIGILCRRGGTFRLQAEPSHCQKVRSLREPMRKKRRYFDRIRWFQSPNRLALQGDAQCAFRLPNRKVPSLPNSTQGRSRAPQASLQCAEPPCFFRFCFRRL